MLDYVPTLETERLILKAPTEKHTYSWEANFAHWDIIKNLTTATPWPYPKGGAMDFFKNMIEPHLGKTIYIWGIFLKEDRDCTNMSGCVHIELKTDNGVGYWLAKELWGKGYMSEAIYAIYDLMFDKTNIECLFIDNATGNPASGNISKKAGANLTATVDDVGRYVNPEFNKSQKWKLSREDWLKNKEAKGITQPLYKIT